MFCGAFNSKICYDKTNESDPTEKKLFQNSKLNKQKHSGDFVNSIY